ncbi:hypothetical protein LJC45_03775 [Alistipes sp. OttesenSCG-928-B03]|nr:hypothetical protein [Alistipes sp. OttesenSCG-928-B03]
MRTRLYNILLSTFALLGTGCALENGGLAPEPAPIPTPETETECVLDFDVLTADESVATLAKAAIMLGDIQNMFVLVFDQNGNFLSRTQAERGETPGRYRVTLTATPAELPAGEKVRIVHFICNYDWSGFSDDIATGKHENEVVSPLSVADNNMIYWQRVELAEGITQNAFKSPISLLRNMAKISVNNNSLAGAGSNPFLTDVSFALGAYLDQGTVAPFNTSNLEFEERAVVESPFAATRDVTHYDFTYAGIGDWGIPVYCYEKKNSTSGNPLYVIIRARYNNASNYTYYKIDVIHHTADMLYDIERNCHYKITISDVTGPGRETLEEAMSSAASNNLLYSVVLEDYTSISDGISMLNVEMTVKTLVEANKQFEIGFSYFPAVNGPENNTIVQVELQQSSIASEQVIGSWSVVKTAGSACIRAVTSPSIPQYSINSAKFVITAIQNGVVLRRVVQLRLRTPFEFGNFSVSSGISQKAGSPVAFSFTIPNTIREQLYPFPVYFTTKQLSPNLATGMDSSLTLDYQIAGSYRYAYMVKNPGVHIVHFKTAMSSVSETVTVESELFETIQRQVIATQP